MQLLIFIISLFFFNSVWAAKTFTILSAKDVYPLNYETIYKVNICTGYSTVIELPQGFTLEHVVLGDSKLFAAEKADNRVVLKRLAPDEASTNLVLIATSPDKVTRSLTFELSGRDFPRVSNVEFEMPEQVGKDPKLEAARQFYQTQVELALLHQEKRLSEVVRNLTLEKLETFHLEGDLSEKKLGVHIHLDAVVNNGGKGYVYVSTNTSDSAFQIVTLTGIQAKDLAKTVQLFRTTKDEHGTRYIYETTPFVKCGDPKAYTFFFRVYHENAQLKPTLE